MEPGGLSLVELGLEECDATVQVDRVVFVVQCWHVLSRLHVLRRLHAVGWMHSAVRMSMSVRVLRVVGMDVVQTRSMTAAVLTHSGVMVVHVMVIRAVLIVMVVHVMLIHIMLMSLLHPAVDSMGVTTAVAVWIHTDSIALIDEQGCAA